MLQGKKIAVLGVADRESIAWSIAKSLSQQGAQVKIGYQQKFLSRIHLLLKENPNILAQRCDVLNLDEVEAFFDAYRTEGGGTHGLVDGLSHGLDGLVHAIAYGPSTVFTNLPSEVNAADFGETLEISTHSLAKVVGVAKAVMNPGASVLTLTFQASERAMPLYGLMGVAKAALESLVRYLAVELGQNQVRINAISAGPVETLAALSEIVAFCRNPAALEKLPGSRLGEFIQKAKKEFPAAEDELQLAKQVWSQIQREIAERSPIRDILTAEDVADTALFFLSERSKKITGQVLHVDCGLSASQWM